MPAQLIIPFSDNPPPIHSGLWTAEEDAALRSLYAIHTREQIAEVLGRGEPSIRSRCWTLGLNTKHPKWTDEDVAFLVRHYTERKGKPIYLAELAQRFGRTKSCICAKAKSLGLETDTNRPEVEERKQYPPKYANVDDLRAAQRERRREWHRTHEHPRGMLGKKHTDTVKRRTGEASRERWAKLTPEERDLWATKSLKTKIERYGTGRPNPPGGNPYSRCKSGRRADLGGQFFRSSWEANYARYLNWLISLGEIASWEYEPKTFVFEGVTRGALSYLPDFRVIGTDGAEEYHEVKGWMTSEARTRLKRMAEYYPDVTVILIDEDRYRGIAKHAPMIAGWESPGDELPEDAPKAQGPVCSVIDCERERLARGLCSRHYAQAQKALRGGR